MNEEKIWLKELTEKDGIEGLTFLQNLVNEEGIMVAPAPKDIDEETYPNWLKSNVDNTGFNMINGYSLLCHYTNRDIK